MLVTDTTQTTTIARSDDTFLVDFVTTTYYSFISAIYIMTSESEYHQLTQHEPESRVLKHSQFISHSHGKS